MTRLSIITVTYNRPGGLARCLDALEAQTRPPDEIIVIDNGTATEARRSVDERRDGRLQIRYLRNEGPNALTIGRNVGVREASGDILAFVDDDVLVDERYVEALLAVYEEYPDAVGVMGHLRGDSPRVLSQSVHRFFGLSRRESNGGRVLASVGATYPTPLDRIIRTEWLSGSLFSYRRFIFDELSFDEQLLKYSEGEDLESSFRVHQRYPGRLYATPHAFGTHEVSAEGRAANIELVRMQEVYGLYLFFKLFGGTRASMLYVHSRVGRLAIALARALLKPSRATAAEVWYRAAAYFLCLRHIQELRRGDVEFFNRTLS